MTTHNISYELHRRRVRPHRNDLWAQLCDGGLIKRCSRSSRFAVVTDTDEIRPTCSAVANV
jgi:hypothetical protein